MRHTKSNNNIVMTWLQTSIQIQSDNLLVVVNSDHVSLRETSKGSKFALQTEIHNKLRQISVTQVGTYTYTQCIIYDTDIQVNALPMFIPRGKKIYSCQNGDISTSLEPLLHNQLYMLHCCLLCNPEPLQLPLIFTRSLNGHILFHSQSYQPPASPPIQLPPWMGLIFPPLSFPSTHTLNPTPSTNGPHSLP